MTLTGLSAQSAVTPLLARLGWVAGASPSNKLGYADSKEARDCLNLWLRMVVDNPSITSVLDASVFPLPIPPLAVFSRRFGSLLSSILAIPIDSIHRVTNILVDSTVYDRLLAHR